MALPAGPPRPLGLRLAVADRPLQGRDERRNARRGRRAVQDRLGLPGRQEARKTDLPDPRGEGPTGPVAEDLADPAGADDGTVQPDRSDAGSRRNGRRSGRLEHAETEDPRFEG